MRKEVKDMLVKKVKAVELLEKAVLPNQENVERVMYEIWHKKGNDDLYVEYLVVCYKGGAMSVKSCTGNSFYATYKELGECLDSGYYAELKDYVALTTDPSWVMMEV